MALLLLLGTITAFHYPHNDVSIVTTRRKLTSATTNLRLYGESIKNNNNLQEKEEILQQPEKKSSSFVERSFLNSPSECDNINSPPSLLMLLRSMSELANGSDIRGTFVDHPRMGSIASVAHTVDATASSKNKNALLTPLAAYCIGKAFVLQLVKEEKECGAILSNDSDFTTTICIGTDPRSHGPRLADAFARGAKSVADNNRKIRVLYTGLATTPSIMEFCCTNKCDYGVMVTASHLPMDRNGFKFFSNRKGGYSSDQISQIMELARAQLRQWQNLGILPPTSGGGAVFADEFVDFMPLYAQSLREALVRECHKENTIDEDKPLRGLKLVLNAGHGSGGFFARDVLEVLGADVSGSMCVEPDPNFPQGVPNPENEDMINDTIKRCTETNADMGILLDTDADRSGFVLPNNNNEYEPLNRNRLIAMMGVIYSLSGGTIVTDSTTSEGLNKFLTENLNLKHVRYKRGYANVIAKAKSIGDGAEVAIETSGHCALKENNYLDDGTYTSVKLVGLLARTASDKNIFDFVQDLQEMPIEKEFRLNVLEGNAMTVFEELSNQLVSKQTSSWSLETEDNYEGIRFRVSNNNNNEGAFFMIRPSLHDPVLSLQLECESSERAHNHIVRPLLESMDDNNNLSSSIDWSPLREYLLTE